MNNSAIFVLLAAMLVAACALPYADPQIGPPPINPTPFNPRPFPGVPNFPRPGPFNPNVPSPRFPQPGPFNPMPYPGFPNCPGQGPNSPSPSMGPCRFPRSPVEQTRDEQPFDGRASEPVHMTYGFDHLEPGTIAGYGAGNGQQGPSSGGGFDMGNAVRMDAIDRMRKELKID